ncbi:MAG TPA: hypothetical protein VF594_06230 [Rubricoccaceae bacterium]|jgi:hypothetical protein
MAAHRRRARLTPADTSAHVALGQAQLDGIVENVRLFGKEDRTLFRVEVVVDAAGAEALLAALAELEPDTVR